MKTTLIRLSRGELATYIVLNLATGATITIALFAFIIYVLQ
jgi:hypothetical protein